MVRSTFVFMGALGLVALGCTRTAEPVAAAVDAAPPARDAAARPSVRPRDLDGHLIPRTDPPHLIPSLVPSAPSHEPDWDLDAADPARDYALRYVRATNRYGDATACVDASPSHDTQDGHVVEIHDAVRANCPAPKDAPRETFRVAIADDHLDVVGAKFAPLARWPDGSDPLGPPNPPHNDPDAARKKSPLRDAMIALQLTPIQVQFYGRGSYPVYTLAGWHPPITPDATKASLDEFATKLCVVTNGLPFGLFAGIDRAKIFRVRCPNASAWQTL